MKNLRELIDWAQNELQLPQNEINFKSKIFLKACIEHKKEIFFKKFMYTAWDEELIDLYFDSNLNLDLFSVFKKTELESHYIIGLMNHNKYNEIIENFSDISNEMKNIFFEKLSDAEIDYNFKKYVYFNKKEDIKKIIVSGRIELLLNASTSNYDYDEESYKLLEGKMLDLEIVYNLNNIAIPKHFLLNNDYKLFKELLDNNKYMHLINNTEYKEIFENKEMYDYLFNKFFSLPDTPEYNQYFKNTKLNEDPLFLKRVIEEERVNFLNLHSDIDFSKEAWSIENQKLFFDLVKKNPLVNDKSTNYSKYIKNYNTTNLSKWKNTDFDISKFNENSIYAFAEDVHNNVVNTNNKLLKEYYEFIYQTKSSSIIYLTKFLLNSDFNNLNLLFNENGITDYFKEYLLYDKSYLMYCLNNNIDIMSDIKDINYATYAKIIVKYPDITKNIIITKDNINDYIENGKINRTFVESLYNKNGINSLLSMIDDNISLELSLEEIYALNKTKEFYNGNIKSSFLKCCLDNTNILTNDKIDKIAKLIDRIDKNNSDEIRKKSSEIVNEILKYPDPEERLNEIEEIFDEDYIPEFGKRYFMYKILYSKENIRKKLHSPILKNADDTEFDKIVLFDLLKSSLGSFNVDLLNYIEKVKKGYDLYCNIKNNSTKLESLSNEEILLLNDFRKKIDFYSKYLYKFDVDKVVSDYESINKFENQLKEKINYPQNMPFPLMLNEIVKELFGDFGFDRLFELEMYAHKLSIYKTVAEEARNYKNIPFKIDDGDFLKGIDGKYIDNILKYGSLCVEMLGENAGSDLTPMDTDMSIINGENLTIPDVLGQNTIAAGFDKVKLVISKEYMENFGEVFINRDGNVVTNEDKRKIEIFPVKDTHYCIRTGFPATFIKAIIADPSNKVDINQIKFDIVKNGFYIPIFNSNGNLVFSYEEYEKLSKQKAGLKYYHDDNYSISENLETKDIIEISKTLADTKTETADTKNAIYRTLNEVFKKYFNGVKYKLDGSMTPGIIEIFDTGSSGRGTNLPKVSDFDFLVRVDKSFMNGPFMRDFYNDVDKALNSKRDGITYSNVTIPGVSDSLEIDFPVVEKTNKVIYSTDECIKDRLSTIQEKYPDKYNLVIANIIYAKKLLKNAEAYKPKGIRNNPQGGLGGVGVENWILQNGGSLLDASINFLEAAKESNYDLSEFQRIYPIYDFGKNLRGDSHSYDNYVYHFNKDGFEKTVDTLKEYVNKVKMEYNNSISENLEENVTVRL